MQHARTDYQKYIQDDRNPGRSCPEDIPLAAAIPGGIPADEPVFLLRGQDVNAAEVVRFWAHLAQESGADEATVASALAQAEAMDAWPVKKTPDTP